jgi:hypothetical protein
MNSPALLMEIPPMEFALLWGELVEAYHGVNGYGGDTAQLYAYRFAPYAATLSSDAEPWFKARYKLIALLEVFCQAYNCHALVNGRGPSHYQHETFSWRANVQIIKITSEVNEDVSNA